MLDRKSKLITGFESPYCNPTLAPSRSRMPLRQFRARVQRANNLESWSMDSASSTLSGSRVKPARIGRLQGRLDQRRNPAESRAGRREIRRQRPHLRHSGRSAHRRRSSSARRARPQGRKSGQIGTLERQGRNLREIEPRRRPVDAFRPRQAMRDRNAHVRDCRAARSASRRGIRPVRARSTAACTSTSISSGLQARTDGAPRSLPGPCSSASPNRS